MTSHPHARANLRSRPGAARAPRRAGSGRRALCGGAAARFGRADRSATIRTIRSRASSCPMRRSSIASRRTQRSDRRRRAQPGRRHRASLSRPRAAQAHPCLRGLLPVLFPPRNGRAPTSRTRCRRRRLPRALDYIRATRPNLGSDPHRRRSAGAVGAPAARGDEKPGRDRARQGRAHPHPRSDRRSGAHHARTGARAQDQGQADLRGGARQSCARTDAAGARGLRADGRCRHSAAGAIGAAGRRQRYAGGAGRTDARLGRMPDQAVLFAPRRSGARHRASAHRHRDRAGVDARPARASVGAYASRLMCSIFPAATANRRSGRTISSARLQTAASTSWSRISMGSGINIRRE